MTMKTWATLAAAAGLMTLLMNKQRRASRSAGISRNTSNTGAGGDMEGDMAGDRPEAMSGIDIDPSSVDAASTADMASSGRRSSVGGAI